MSPDSENELPYNRGGALLATSIFLGAFLIFQVQPLIAKVILPWFGGSTAVWLTCMLFFQVTLLLGYTYAHLITFGLSLRQQAVFHTTLLSTSLILLPIAPDAAWKPSPGDDPTLRILLILMVTVGLPFLLLSSTGPLLQRWFSHLYPDRSPYRLYALSNTGSLLALLTYPVVVEPLLASRSQTLAWSSMYAFFILLVAGCAWHLWKVDAPASRDTTKLAQSAHPLDAPEQEDSSPNGLRILVWIALSMTGSAMLLATTNQICQNVASVPFLWILPLSIYLVTFILCFDSDGWYRRDLVLWVLAVGCAGSGYVLKAGLEVSLPLLIGVYSCTLFAACMACHGELVRLRPGARHLTLFYLMLSCGGALGGIFVSLLAPIVFDAYREFIVSLALCCVLILLVRRLDAIESRVAEWKKEPGKLTKVTVVGVLLTTLASGLMILAMRSYLDSLNVIAMSRDFYGTLQISRHHPGDPEREALHLSHGTVQHGVQFGSKQKRRLATAYYGEGSGPALAIRMMRSHLVAQPGNDQPGLKIGAVGLGVGTIAAYGEPGDRLRFYEISPKVGDYAEEFFSFLGDARKRGADVKVLIGDGRLLLESELAADDAQAFDILVVDAFSGDAIPVHLLTRECFDVYLRHLNPSGMLAIHVSNEYVDLEPVVRGLAALNALHSWPAEAVGNEDLGTFPTKWILVSRHDFFADDSTRAWPNEPFDTVLWTDDFSSLYQVLR